MHTCLNCPNTIPNWIKLDGKFRCLRARKYCLTCSPFKSYNRRQLHLNLVPKTYKTLSTEDRKRFNSKTGKAYAARRRSKKKQLVLHFGGKCISCGYDKNLAALTFHHRDPKDKSHGVSISGSGKTSLKELIKEASKCDLLCHNCHTETHHPDLNEWLTKSFEP